MTVIVAQKSVVNIPFTNANKNGLSYGAFTFAQPNASIPRIFSNAAANSSTAGFFPAVLTSHNAMTDTHAAWGTNVGACNANGWGLIVGADSAFDNYAYCSITSTNVVIGYGTGPTSGELTQLAAKGAVPSSFATGQAWRFEKHVAANGAMYRVYCNTTLELEYTDTALVVPNGQNNRLGGLIVTRNGVVNSPGVDDFAVADIYP